MHSSRLAAAADCRLEPLKAKHDQAIDLVQAKLGTSTPRGDLIALSDTLSFHTASTAVSLDADHLSRLGGFIEPPLFESETVSAARRLRDVMVTAYAALPLLDQCILALRFGRNLTMAEIALRLNGTAGGIQRRFHRLISKLRIRLAEEGITDADIRDVIESARLDACLFEPILRDITVSEC